ncbi:bifunctional hydroxymethylpyrimidine kinase/phosphomethylpyrimidine kinase [Bacillus piscicola]|uniref:bifunctional hydroxymethylpyrimidine kinase/phosphomethylpyrimidine kinase n=1 Tax=Bacillus piscicola TaxID=1632684 RepID=UPI001F09800D|nr:bifunctional hydroxymethylpyrimidine kinase/phosphomethylpyrimidine kinase [Bacillus piscicola]
MKRVLSIAGSSSMGGAGIQADLKTFQECGVYGMGAITAFVTISKEKGRNIFPQPLGVMEAQVLTALNTIGVDALKTGLLHSVEQMEYTAQLIQDHNLKHVVVDPVIVTKSGAELIEHEAIERLKKVILPKAAIVTPNVPEALKLSGRSHIESTEDMKRAAVDIHALGPKSVVVKGGRLDSEEAVDVLFDGERFVTFSCKRISTDTNGAGCTFSAAIAAELAKEDSVREAVKKAKTYITGAIHSSVMFLDESKRINHSALRHDASSPSIHISEETLNF